MSYQVLARKWRPSKFSELVGQAHVVSAITNGLQQGRLHHAYLFAGTRGVGKTTIARIFAKSLNCELGVSAEPCGQCNTCLDIDAGRYVDLLEIDAASRTKVEDTRDILDNVQYKPTRGQFKVYLIDEVHMLSKHSFNALLKTLEEPPEHVKFLFATTDPQKLPVTILSRCLQFNLKALTKEQIQQQLKFVLGEEKILAEDTAVNHLAKAARGSMRDALSLTDQAIAQGNGSVTAEQVIQMLGLMDANILLPMVIAILEGNKTKVFEQLTLIDQKSPDYQSVLSEILSLFHQIALTQLVPEACKVEAHAARVVYGLAKDTPPEQIQLMYQIGIQGRKDLPFAADPSSGFEMTLLRMLSFNPETQLATATEMQAMVADAQQQRIALSASAAPLPSLAVEANAPHSVNASLNASPELSSHVASEFITQTDETSASTVSSELSQAAGISPVEADHYAQMEAQLASEQNMVEMQSQALREQVPQDIESPQPTAADTQKQSSGSIDALLALHDDLATPITSEDEKKNVTSGETGEPKANFEFTRENISSETPPWLQNENPPSAFEVLSKKKQDVDEVVESPVQPDFDATQPLEADVTIDVPVFNQKGDKITKAAQLDQWSELIEVIGLRGLVKQLALCADYHRDDASITLTVLPEKEDLATPSAVATIQNALTEYCGHDVQVTVKFAAASNIPAAIQQEIGTTRQAHAESVIQNDEGIHQLHQLLGATVIEGSIEPR